MINFWSIFLVAVALSMDAFSLAIGIGINSNNNKKKTLFILLVGICHYFFPWFGIKLGKTFFSTFVLNSEKVLGVILILLAIDMIYEYFTKKDEFHLSYLSIIIMAFSVSIDSFMTGIGLFSLNDFFATLITFSLTSMTFTFLGIYLGQLVNKIMGKYSDKLGIIILLVLGVKYLLF